MKTGIIGFAILGLVTAPVPALARAKDKQPTIITLSGDNIITGQVETGQEDALPISLIVDAATPDRPILNPQFVEKAQLSSSFIGGAFGIGPVKIRAKTGVVKYRFDGMDYKRRSLWTDRVYTQRFDGSVGPGGIPYDIVIFQLRTAQADEQDYVYPLVENGNSVFEYVVNGKTIEVTLTQKRDRTLATAAAGALMAENFGGSFTGDVETAEIAYGVERPIRSLQLTAPITLLGRSVDQLFVRTQDNGDSSGIKVSDAAKDDGQEDGDSSEIVVIGKNGKNDKNRYALSIGRDDLSHCSSITYDRPAKLIRLRCQAL